MPELRQNIITREWVIIAKERAKRPDEFKRPKREELRIPKYDPACPFCPGNESMTTEESFRSSCAEGWEVRVVGNKYPALSHEGERIRWIDGVHRSMTAWDFTRS